MSWRQILQPGMFYRPVLTIFGDNRPMLGFYVPMEARAQPAPVNGQELLEHLGYGAVTGKPCDRSSGPCACGLWHASSPEPPGVELTGQTRVDPLGFGVMQLGMHMRGAELAPMNLGLMEETLEWDVPEEALEPMTLQRMAQLIMERGFTPGMEEGGRAWVLAGLTGWLIGAWVPGLACQFYFVGTYDKNLGEDDLYGRTYDRAIALAAMLSDAVGQWSLASGHTPDFGENTP